MKIESLFSYSHVVSNLHDFVICETTKEDILDTQWKLVGFDQFKTQKGHSEFYPYDFYSKASECSQLYAPFVSWTVWNLSLSNQIKTLIMSNII